jgi:hypothetical protein
MLKKSFKMVFQMLLCGFNKRGHICLRQRQMKQAQFTLREEITSVPASDWSKKSALI